MSHASKYAFALMILCLFILPPAFTSMSADKDEPGATSGPRYSDWSAPELVSAANTTQRDYPNGISRDGLTLYFQRSNPPSIDEDLYVVHRPDLDSEWGEPVKLPDTINTTANERAASVSADGHWLFFASNRPGGKGNMDIYVSWRRHVHDDDAWEPPMALAAINSVGFDAGACLLEDEESGTTQLYFGSAPFPGGAQLAADIYVSMLGPDGFGAPSPVRELNTSAMEGGPRLRHDGREIYFVSDRNGLPNEQRVFVSTRHSSSEPWGDPVMVPFDTDQNGLLAISTPVLSWNGLELFIGMVRSSDFGNVLVCTREKLNGKR